MIDFEQRNEKENRDWEEVLPPGENELVSLNTLIPRKLSKQLAEATGWLQVENPRLRYTKQATVQLLLERALESFFEDIKNYDNEVTEETPRKVLADDSKVIDIIKSKRSGIDVKQYEQFSNKYSGGYKYRR